MVSIQVGSGICNLMYVLTRYSFIQIPLKPRPTLFSIHTHKGQYCPSCGNQRGQRVDHQLAKAMQFVLLSQWSILVTGDPLPRSAGSQDSPGQLVQATWGLRCLRRRHVFRADHFQVPKTGALVFRRQNNNHICVFPYSNTKSDPWGGKKKNDWEHFCAKRTIV